MTSRSAEIETPMDLFLWRERLREHLYRTRPRWCDVCGVPFTVTGFEVHEGIVTRQDARGWGIDKKALIYDERNCVMLCPRCHRPQPPARQEVWDMQCERYGEGAMREWYEGLPWKAGVPRRFWGS